MSSPPAASTAPPSPAPASSPTAAPTATAASATTTAIPRSRSGSTRRPICPTLPRPDVIWRAATFAEIRFACGPACHTSYFFEAKRRRLSPPRPQVLDVDLRRLLVAQEDGRDLAVRQIFSGREVARITRDWTPARHSRDALTDIHFDPDGRLTFTWLKGKDRTPVTERVSVPSIPR